MKILSAKLLQDEIREKQAFVHCNAISEDILCIVIDNYQLEGNNDCCEIEISIGIDESFYRDVWTEDGLCAFLNGDLISDIIKKFENAGYTVTKKRFGGELSILDISWENPQPGRRTRGIWFTAEQAKEKNKIARFQISKNNDSSPKSVSDYFQEAYKEFVEHLNESINQGKRLEIYEYETDMPIKMIDKFIDKFQKLGYTVYKEDVDDEDDTRIKTLTIALPFKENENDV